MITREQLAKAMNYMQYRNLLDELYKLGKTTGHDQGEEKVGYARVNIQRMQRLDKTVTLIPELKEICGKINKDYTWLVLTEGWCGDTAQNIPVMRHIDTACPKIHLRLLLRDDNPEVMDQYLSNGSRSIPKLVCFENESLRELFTWGPRPVPLQQKVRELMATNPSKEEKGLMTQNWYNTDKTITLQEELLGLIREHMTGK